MTLSPVSNARLGALQPAYLRVALALAPRRQGRNSVRSPLSGSASGGRANGPRRSGQRLARACAVNPGRLSEGLGRIGVVNLCRPEIDGSYRKPDRSLDLAVNLHLCGSRRLPIARVKP